MCVPNALIFAGTNFVILEIRLLPPALLPLCEGLVRDAYQAVTESKACALLCFSVEVMGGLRLAWVIDRCGRYRSLCVRYEAWICFIMPARGLAICLNHSSG